MSADPGATRRRRWRHAAEAAVVVLALLFVAAVGVVIGRATAPGPDIVVAAAPVVEESPKIESMPIGAPVDPSAAAAGGPRLHVVPSASSQRPVIDGVRALSDAPGTAAGYRVVRAGLDGSALASTLADVFGIFGTVVQYADSWLVGADDGSAPSLRVEDDASMSWAYSDPLAASAAQHTAAPIQSRASRLASALLGQVGVDPKDVDWQVERGDATTVVTAWQLVGGQRTQLGWRVVFGPGAAVVSATGFAAGLEELPDYATIGARTAVERATAPPWSELGPVQVTPPTATPSPSATPSSAATGRALTVAVPRVTVVDSRLGLAQYWQPDGQLLILPTYLLRADDGSEWALIAVANGYVDFVDEPEGAAVGGAGEVR